jgi:hypothetical protein
MTDNTFELQCGIVLELQKINTAVIEEINLKAFSDLLRDPRKSSEMAKLSRKGKMSDEDILSLFGSDIGAMAALGDKMFTYCVGWGVKNNPPEDDDELLSLLGAPQDKIYTRRAVWVRTLLVDSAEGNRLVAHIQAISSAENDVVDEKDVEIEELKARLQELENGK